MFGKLRHVQKWRDARFDLVRRERLTDISLGPSRKSAHHIRRASFRRNHDDRNAQGKPLLLSFFDKLQPIHHRHIDVAEDQVECVVAACRLPQHRQRLYPIAGLDHISQVPIDVQFQAEAF